jgi:hypothetical protein
MLVTRRAEIIIKADPQQIWDFVNDPAQWMASNPEEHYGTEFLTPDKKVASGGRFYQRESVAGVRADMKGHFLHVDRPNSVSWTGVAEYRFLGGLFRFRVPQSGIVKLETRPDGVMASHEMFIDIPDTWLGKLVAQYLTKSRNVEKRLYEHGQKELVYFKTQIERLGTQSRVDRSLGKEPVAHG